MYHIFSFVPELSMMILLTENYVVLSRPNLPKCSNVPLCVL